MGNSFGGLLVLNPYLFLKIANFAVLREGKLHD
jgi:hypothetical protein